MSEVVNVVVSGARKVAEDVVTFVTTPMGPFEAVDRVVRDVRNTGRQLLTTVGLRVPSMGGQIVRIRPLEELRRRLRI